MDKYAAAVRKYLLHYFAGYGEVIDGKILHVHFVDEWKGYRIYDHWIDDGRVVEPAYPPIYIMVDKDCNVRWMTKKEAYDYQEGKDMLLMMGRGYSECFHCSGTGRMECDGCGGYGKVRATCGYCEGSGQVKTVCPDCNGRGKK